jgi:hypothetical protein
MDAIIEPSDKNMEAQTQRLQAMKNLTDMEIDGCNYGAIG